MNKQKNMELKKNICFGIKIIFFNFNQKLELHFHQADAACRKIVLAEGNQSGRSYYRF
jgi:hypothetical protein